MAKENLCAKTSKTQDGKNKTFYTQFGEAMESFRVLLGMAC